MKPFTMKKFVDVSIRYALEDMPCKQCGATGGQGSNCLCWL
jgi:hypothetical protein